jgi:flagellum-specific peptidoglycan hydrolase FlgJ
MTFYHKDDDYDSNNKLIDSCFRKYDTVLESYVDRSNFLKQSSRYAVLFTYEKDDYNRWALGLQKCGYATDPNYARSLIRIIEELSLYQYDSAANPWFQPVVSNQSE